MESEMLVGTSLKNENPKKAHFELKPKERTSHLKICRKHISDLSRVWEKDLEGGDGLEVFRP